MNTRVTNSCGFSMAIKEGFTCGQLATPHILTSSSKFIYFAGSLQEDGGKKGKRGWNK